MPSGDSFNELDARCTRSPSSARLRLVWLRRRRGHSRSLVRPIFCGIALLAAAACLAADDALERARAVLARHPIIDGHNDLPWAIRENATAPRDVEAYDLRTPHRGRTPTSRACARAASAGSSGPSTSRPTTAMGSRASAARADRHRPPHDRAVPGAPRLRRRPPTRSSAPCKAGKIASLLGIEGGHAIENSLGALRAYYDLGVRYMTLTHTETLDWADAATDAPRHGGLTPFGEEVVREMNRLGHAGRPVARLAGHHGGRAARHRRRR